MRLKPGVNPKHVHPLLWERLWAADERHEQLTGVELWLTSLRRAPKAGSRHSPRAEALVTAADIRRHHLDELGLQATVDFCRWLQRELGLGVLLEPEWMTPRAIVARGGIDKIDPHIHTELKLEPDELFEVTA